MTYPPPNLLEDIEKLTTVVGNRKVAIDAGHYSPRLNRVKRKSDLNKELPIIINVKSSTDVSGGEFSRVAMSNFDDINHKLSNDDRDWIIFNTHDDFLLAKITQPFYWQFSLPTDTEKHTLKIAIEYYKGLRNNNIETTLFVLLGDVWTRSELRIFCREFANKHYIQPVIEKEEIAEIIMINETTCKNKGDQIITKKWSDTPTNLDKRQKLYDSIGGTIAYASKTSPLFFTSHALLNDKLEDHHAIALTKSNRPSCAVTLAGKFMILETQGYSYSISVHDFMDDPLINQKVIDGALLAVHFGVRTIMEFKVCVFDRAEFAESTIINSRDYDLTSSNSDIDNLISFAKLSGSHLTSGFMQDTFTESCCPVIKKKS